MNRPGKSAGRFGRSITSFASSPQPVLPSNKALEILAKNQPRIQDVLKGLDTDLVLSLRNRGGVALSACPPPADQLMSYSTKPDQKAIIGTLLEARLKKLAEYDSEAVRQRFVELERLTRPP